jgi:hypothetical protein
MQIFQLMIRLFVTANQNDHQFKYFNANVFPVVVLGFQYLVNRILVHKAFLIFDLNGDAVISIPKDIWNGYKNVGTVFSLCFSTCALSLPSRIDALSKALPNNYCSISRVARTNLLSPLLTESLFCRKFGLAFIGCGFLDSTVLHPLRPS